MKDKVFEKNDIWRRLYAFEDRRGGVLDYFEFLEYRKDDPDTIPYEDAKKLKPCYLLEL